MYSESSILLLRPTDRWLTKGFNWSKSVQYANIANRKQVGSKVYLSTKSRFIFHNVEQEVQYTWWILSDIVPRNKIRLYIFAWRQMSSFQKQMRSYTHTYVCMYVMFLQTACASKMSKPKSVILNSQIRFARPDMYNTVINIHTSKIKLSLKIPMWMIVFSIWGVEKRWR